MAIDDKSPYNIYLENNNDIHLNATKLKLEEKIVFLIH